MKIVEHKLIKWNSDFFRESEMQITYPTKNGSTMYDAYRPIAARVEAVPIGTRASPHPSTRATPKNRASTRRAALFRTKGPKQGNPWAGSWPRENAGF